jgi:hypothetical protein
MGFNIALLLLLASAAVGVHRPMNNGAITQRVTNIVNKS